MPVAVNNANPAHILNKSKMRRQNCAKKELNYKRILNNVQRNAYNAGYFRLVHRFLQKQTLTQANLAPGNNHYQRRHRHNAKTADLYQRNQHHFAEPRKLVANIDNRQPRNARSRRCRKQRIKKSKALPVLRGNWQHKQKRAGQNKQHKA